MCGYIKLKFNRMTWASFFFLQKIVYSLSFTTRHGINTAIHNRPIYWIRIVLNGHFKKIYGTDKSWCMVLIIYPLLHKHVINEVISILPSRIWTKSKQSSISAYKVLQPPVTLILSICHVWHHCCDPTFLQGIQSKSFWHLTSHEQLYLSHGMSNNQSNPP